MSTDILRIIEGGLSNDKRKIINYSKRLAERLKAEGDEEMAECILAQIEASTSRSAATMDAMRMIPLDADSKLQIVEVIPENSKHTDIVLSDVVERRVKDFINVVNNSDELELSGLDLQKSLLLYGAPGCGKTSIAHYISEQTGLPLVVARLDGIVSSLLGSTAKNLRKIFQYASSMPCILFLDEFDAIAKARDDNHELGELKRVINSLLQNIDELPSSCVLLAATNHPDLLDKAVWRRFFMKLEVEMPDKDAIVKIVTSQLSGFDATVTDDSAKMNILTDLLKDFSPSDIVTMLNKLKVQSVINGTKQISYEQIVAAIYEYDGKHEKRDDFVKYLSQYGVAQTSISILANISVRQVRNILSEK